MKQTMHNITDQRKFCDKKLFYCYVSIKCAILIVIFSVIDCSDSLFLKFMCLKTVG